MAEGRPPKKNRKETNIIILLYPTTMFLMVASRIILKRFVEEGWFIIRRWKRNINVPQSEGCKLL